MTWHNVEKIEEVLCDKKLSLSAKGLFVILNRLVAIFECSEKVLKEYCKNNDCDIHSALVELVAYGYVKKEYLDCYNEEK